MGREMALQMVDRGEIVAVFESGKPRVTVRKDTIFMDRYIRFNPDGAANLIYKQMKSLLS